MADTPTYRIRARTAPGRPVRVRLSVVGTPTYVPGVPEGTTAVPYKSVGYATLAALVADPSPGLPVLALVRDRGDNLQAWYEFRPDSSTPADAIVAAGAQVLRPAGVLSTAPGRWHIAI